MAGNTIQRSATAAGICVAAVLGAACQKEPGPAAPPNKPAPTVKAALPVKKGPTPEELTAGMVLAAPQDKSPLALDMKFDLGARPRVGQPLDINVALILQAAGGPASLQITNASGFAAPEAGAIDIPDMEPGEVYRHTLKLTPRSEGLLLVGLTVSMKHDDVTDAKVFSIPVIVDAK
jgi:hypothetical protein